MMDIVQFSNEGIKILVNVKKPDGSARDLTGATGLKIKLKSALSSAGKTFTASFEDAASLGVLTCTLGAGDIDALGTWKAQAYYELGGFKGHTHPEEIFYVEGNLA